MQRYDYIIIGLGICGATAAETIRKNDPDGSILVIGEESHLTYSRVLLPHVVRGKVGEEKIWLKRDEAFVEQRIDVRRGVSVTHIDTATKTVTTSDANVFGYSKLLIATGGTPKRLTCDGAENITVQRLQTIEDAREVAAAPKGTSAVIGGGFIALELIMSYAQRGCEVVALLRKDGFFSSVLDAASKRALSGVLREHGIDVRTDVEVVSVRHEGDATVVCASDGAEIHAQTVGLGIGIDANVSFLKGSGIETRRGVVTDAELRTNVPDVYAAGDAAEFFDPLVGEHHVVGNWQNALFQAKLAGENMTGNPAPFSRVTSYSISCFGLPLAFLGATDIAPDKRIVRDNGCGQIVQIFIKGGRAIAATCIGPFTDRAWITELIEKRILWTDTEGKTFLESGG